MRHGKMGNHGPNCRSAVGSASMVSTRLRRRTTRYAPLLCSVLVMGGAEASGCTDWCSRWTPSRVGGHWPGIVPGLLVPPALLSNASGWKHPSRAAALNHESCDGGRGVEKIASAAAGAPPATLCEVCMLIFSLVPGMGAGVGNCARSKWAAGFDHMTSPPSHALIGLDSLESSTDSARARFDPPFWHPPGTHAPIPYIRRPPRLELDEDVRLHPGTRSRPSRSAIPGRTFAANDAVLAGATPHLPSRRPRLRALQGPGRRPHRRRISGLLVVYHQP